MIAKARKFTCELAVSSAEYDSHVVRQLEHRIRARFPKTAPPAAWTVVTGADASGDQAKLLAKGSRVVVVVHQRMWGKDPDTRAHAAAIQQRIAAEGPGFLRVVHLDRATGPAWLRAASSRSLRDGDLDACAEWIVDAVAARGGATRALELADVAARTTENDRLTQQRETFLGSHRAHALLGRELDRLVTEVSRRVATLAPQDPELTADVQRVPGRCTVQLGPVALSLSWVRTRPDSVANGRLLIIEWDGPIGRAATAGQPRAVPRREDVMRVDATRPEDWHWRSDDAGACAYDSRDLAARCVDSLSYALQQRAR